MFLRPGSRLLSISFHLGHANTADCSTEFKLVLHFTLFARIYISNY